MIKKAAVQFSIILVLSFCAPLSPLNAHHEESKTVACISWRAEARYQGVGYNHYVHISNACDTAMSCEVTTNVNPDPIKTTVAAKEKETVLTFRGSPASTFTAEVSCAASQ